MRKDAQTQMYSNQRIACFTVTILLPIFSNSRSRCIGWWILHNISTVSTSYRIPSIYRIPSLPYSLQIYRTHYLPYPPPPPLVSTVPAGDGTRTSRSGRRSARCPRCRSAPPEKVVLNFTLNYQIRPSDTALQQDVIPSDKGEIQ